MFKDHQEKDKGKKGKRGEDRRKYDERKIIKKKIKKNGRDFSYESSLGGIRLNESPLEGIRLMTSPCIRARQELSKKLDKVGNTYKLSKCYFTWLKSKETINSIW